MRYLVIVGTLCAAALPARADTDAEARARELLQTLETATAKAARLETATELADLAPRAVPAIVEFLDRERKSSVDDRRNVLHSIKAAVPDEKGRFRTPARQKADDVRADDEFDWLPLLAELEHSTSVGETIADDAALRALAASQVPAAAQAMLEVAFSEQGMVYRDEIGRYLRKMHPYSIPALIRGRAQTKDGSLSRYARYQLERLDREEPSKAMAAAAKDEQLAAEILRAYQDTKFRHAVGVVLDYVDHLSPTVRRAARETWMSYVTGPAPPEAPKRRLQLPGGRYTDKPEPLWLTYRELADIELDKRYEELFTEEPPRGMSLEDQSKKVFTYYDDEREAAIDAIRTEGAELAASGDVAGAVTRFDRILAVRPTYEHRAEMAPAYLAHALQLEEDEAWRAASTAYAKAHALAPQADRATRALAGYHYTLGRALEAEGKDGSASYGRAVALEPNYAQAREAAERTGVVEPRNQRQWMLYAGLGGGAGAILLLGLGLHLRRRQQATIA